MFNIPGNMKELFEKASAMQEQMGKFKEQAEKIEVEASAGAGLVTVQLTAAGQLKGLQIDKSIINPEDPQMLEDLIKSAVNEGLRKSKDAMKEELQKLTGGIPIPGFS